MVFSSFHSALSQFSALFTSKIFDFWSLLRSVGIFFWFLWIYGPGFERLYGLWFLWGFVTVFDEISILTQFNSNWRRRGGGQLIHHGGEKNEISGLFNSNKVRTENLDVHSSSTRNKGGQEKLDSRNSSTRTKHTQEKLGFKISSTRIKRKIIFFSHCCFSNSADVSLNRSDKRWTKTLPGSYIFLSLCSRMTPFNKRSRANRLLFLFGFTQKRTR